MLLISLANCSIASISNALPDKTNGLLTQLQVSVSFDRIFKENPTSMRNTLQVIGLNNLAKVISSVVKFFVDSLQVANKMQSLDYNQFALLFIEKYDSESVEDLMLALKLAKIEGRKFYNAFGTQDLFEIFNEYQDRKAQQREIQHHNLKNTNKTSVLEAINTSENPEIRVFADLIKNKEVKRHETIIKTNNLVDELNELKAYFSQDDIGIEECLKFKKHCNVHGLKEHLEMIKEVMEGKSL